MLPAANWALKLLDVREEIVRAIRLQLTSAVISSFQDTMAKLNVLKNKIMSGFTSQDVVSSISVFDPSKMQQLVSSELFLNRKIILMIPCTTMGKIYRL